MELPIKHKRGTTVPTANDLVVGEIAINTTTGVCYTKTGAGAVIAIGQDIAALWGGIGGSISNQGDLQDALNLKFPKSGGGLDADAQLQLNGFNGSFLANFAPSSLWVQARDPINLVFPGGWSSQVTLAPDIHGGGVYGNKYSYSTDSNGGYVQTLNGLWYLDSTGIHFYDGTHQSTAAVAPDLSGYLTKAGNLSGLTDLAVARDNLNLGIINAPVFAGLTVQGSGGNVAQLAPTSLSLLHATAGQITLDPQVGVTFPNGTTQNTAAVSFDPTGYATETYVTTRGYLVNGDNGTVPSGGDTGQVLTKASNSNYSFIWSTPIVYDRYLTTSTTSLTINNQNKTLTVGTGLSYTSQQDAIIAYDAAHHMHVRVTAYNSSTGQLDVDVISHTGTGTFASWTVNVGGTVSLQSLEWGGITGTLSNQTDLQTALDAKLSLSGGSMTGKLNCSFGAGGTAINIGTRTGAQPAAPNNGDLWVQGSNFQFKDALGFVRAVPNNDTVNTFTTNQIVSAATTDPLLRLTQTGTGQALVVEDAANPDTSAFIINANGNVGIGQNPATWVPDSNYLLDVSGTTKSNLFWSGGNLASSRRAYLWQEEIALKNGTTGSVQMYYDMSQFGVGATGAVGLHLTSSATGQELRTAIVDGKFWSNTAGAGWVQPYLASGSLAGYALLSGATFTGKVNTTTTATTPSLNLGAAIASGPTSAVNGDIWITNAASPKLAYKTGGVNYYPAVANQFNTFSAGVAITGASASNPQLAVTQTGQGVAVQITTQTGSGHALVVEDQTSPDTDSFVVNASGAVGIGVNPATWTPSRKLEVNGAITCSTLAASADSPDVATTAHVKSVIRGQVISDSSDSYSISGTVFPNTFIKKQDSGTGNTMTITIESNSTQNIPIGTQFVIAQTGTQQFQIVGNGATIQSAGGKYKSSGQYSVCTLIKVDTDEWYLAGDLTT